MPLPSWRGDNEEPALEFYGEATIGCIRFIIYVICLLILQAGATVHRGLLVNRGSKKGHSITACRPTILWAGENSP